MLIGMNDENPMFHHVFQFDLVTNDMRLVLHNERFPSRMVIDNDMNIRLVMEEADNGSLIYYR
jgi:hypothetical protein